MLIYVLLSEMYPPVYLTAMSICSFGKAINYVVYPFVSVCHTLKYVITLRMKVICLTRSIVF